MTASKRYSHLNIGAFGLCLGLAIPLFREIQWSAVTTASRIIARYSYGIYLTHFPIMLFVMSDRRYPQFKVIHQLPHLKALRPAGGHRFGPGSYRRGLAGAVPFDRKSRNSLGAKTGKMDDFGV